MNDQQRRNILGLSEKKRTSYFSTDARDAMQRGRKIMKSEGGAVAADVANRERLGVQAPLHVRTAGTASKIRRGLPASNDHTTWGTSDPLATRKKA